MKKAFVIIVLTSLFLSEMGYFFYYNYELTIVKKEVKKNLLSSGLGNKLLQQIDYSVNHGEIQWEEPGREFYFKGQMYDVVYISKKNGHYLIHCISDKKETALKKTVNNLAQQNSSKPTTNKNKHILKLKITLYDLAGATYAWHTPFPQGKSFNAYQPFSYTAFIEIPGPPPRA